jgi:hypothetical protein
MNNADDNVGAASWLAVECNVAIICASLPSLKVLISKMLPRIISSDSSRRARSQTKLSSSGGEGLEYPLDQWNNSGKRSIDCYGPSGSDIQKHSNGITAMTVLSQESVTRSEDSSTRELVVEASRWSLIPSFPRYCIYYILDLLWHNNGHYLEHVRQRRPYITSPACYVYIPRFIYTDDIIGMQ